MAGGVAPNSFHSQEFLYDFSVNGGTAGAVDLGDLPLGAVVTNVAWVCETAVTSAGSGATIILGTTDDDNGWKASVDAENVFTLLATGTAAPATTQPRTNDAASRDVVMTIGGENLTAGKIRWIFSYYVPSNITLSE